MNILAQRSLLSLCLCVSFNYFFSRHRTILEHLFSILHTVVFEASMARPTDFIDADRVIRRSPQNFPFFTVIQLARSSTTLLQTPTPTVNHSKPPQSKKLSIVQPKYDRYAPIVKGEQPKESRILIKLEQIQQKERQVQSQDYSDMSENVQFEFTY
uniref:Uncharacterized protein n=1 Tax=Heterorhabditis bacteriophora TaxID=37862 RepID=A0A1I7WRJ8_HETBA